MNPNLDSNLPIIGSQHNFISKLLVFVIFEMSATDARINRIEEDLEGLKKLLTPKLSEQEGQISDEERVAIRQNCIYFIIPDNFVIVI